MGGNATTSQGWQGTAWPPSGGHTHTVFDRWFELRSAVRGSGVLRWRVRHPQQLGGSNGALPYITAQQRPHIPGVAGHCLVTLGDHTHTTLAHHYRSHEQRLDTVFDGSNCAQFGWRTVVCTPSLAARPPKVTTQCPAISLGCRRGPWDVEDDVHTTIQHPNCKIRCRQRRMWLCSGCCGLCPPPQPGR